MSAPTAIERAKIINDWKLANDADAVLRGQGFDPGRTRLRQPELVPLAERALREGSALLQPAVIYRFLGIKTVIPGRVTLENGAEFKGVGISRRLHGSPSMIAAIATLGAALDSEVARATVSEPEYAAALDGLATAAISALTAAAYRLWIAQIGAGPLSLTAPLYPGMRGWDMAPGQAQLFSLLDAASIGVQLDASSLMTPAKSVSMVLGVAVPLASISLVE